MRLGIDCGSDFDLILFLKLAVILPVFHSLALKVFMGVKLSVFLIVYMEMTLYFGTGEKGISSLLLNKKE